MGHVHATIKLRNPRREDRREVEVNALADTGAFHLCLPAVLVEELGLEMDTVRTITTADGNTRKCRYVGPVRVQFEDRACYVGALELGNEVLLGAIPMEDMDLSVNPLRQTVIVNPEHPEGPRSFAMGAR